MGVSVIIPCLNEEKYISECLLSLAGNGYSHNELELLVIDGGSTDHTLDIVSQLIAEFPFIRVIPNIKRKTPFALNIGIQQARLNKIMIAGAHAKYPNGYIQKMDELTNQSNIDVAGGGLVTVPSNNSVKSKAIAFVLSHPLGVGNSIFRIGAKELTKVDTVPFGMYRREVFEKAGIYNEQLIRNHDIELSKRIAAAGFSIWLDPTFNCTYFARSTFSALALNNYRNGYWNIRAVSLTRTFRSLSLRHYVPMLFILALLMPLMMVPFIGLKALFINDSILVFYLLTLFVFCFKSIGQQNIFLVLWAFLNLHISYGLGSLMALLTFFKKD